MFHNPLRNHRRFLTSDTDFRKRVVRVIPVLAYEFLGA